MNRALSAAAAVIIVFAAATVARAQVLTQVPSDATLVLKIGNLKDVSAKVAKFSEGVGLVALAPEMADPLKALQEELGLKEGLDTAGELAIVLTKFDEEAPPDEGVYVLVPVTDYKAFLGNLQDVAAEGAISKGTIAGEEVHVANWGKYAAIAPKPTVLGKKPTGLKLTGLAAKEAKEKDAFLYANMQSVSTLALPQIENFRGEILQEIERDLANDADAKDFTNVIKSVVVQVLNVATGFLKDATSASLGLDLNDEGISVTWTADFKPESYSGKLVAGFKNTDQPLLAGLPTGRKYFAALGMVVAPEATSKMVGDLLDPIAKELAATEKGKDFAPLIDSLKRSVAATKSITMGYPAPTGEPGTEAVIQAVAVMEGNSKVIHQTQLEMMKAADELFKMIPQNEQVKTGFEVTPGAKTVDGVKFDAFKQTMEFDPNSPAAAQVDNIMKLMYGPEGAGGVFGAVDADSFLLVQNGTDQLISEAITAARNPKDTLSGDALVKSVAAHLPAKRVAVEYIFVDTIIATGIEYAKSQGVEVPFAIPAGLPPVGVSAGTEASGVRIDTFVPTELINQLVAAGIQAYMQMEGGGPGAPGAPDGL